MENFRICNLKDNKQYCREIAILEHNEWGETYENMEEFNEKIDKKVEKMEELFDNPSFCKLILLEDNVLVGFISIFPTDGEERQDLTPWYATMYVKKEFRGQGFSKVLNKAILDEARNRGFKKIYLKSDLKNYYEKFGAKYIENLKNGEKLYFIEL